MSFGYKEKYRCTNPVGTLNKLSWVASDNGNTIKYVVMFYK